MRMLALRNCQIGEILRQVFRNKSLEVTKNAARKIPKVVDNITAGQ